MTFWNDAFRFVTTTLERAYGNRTAYIFVVRTGTPYRLRSYLNRHGYDYAETVEPREVP